MLHRSTKTYGHNQGLSCVFRQPYAGSHCNQLHGYSLSIGFVFEAHERDENGWVVDFGSLKPVKEKLCEWFDHKLCVAADDPHLSLFQALEFAGVAKLQVFESGVGCENFAKYIFEYVDLWLKRKTDQRCFLHSCEVREHEGNSAIYLRDHTGK
jgi:6-pyruvoyltetrahydropterin/6-carboxytetrahydropterin synthase